MTLGILCVVYTTIELTLALARRGPPRLCFGPVDPTGAVELWLDRRVRSDARLTQLARRSTDR